MTDMRMEKNTIKQKKTWDKNERERDRDREREGGKEMALVFKQKGKAKHFGEL